MKNCLVIGRTNVGKTLFVINFASFLGLKNLSFTFLNSQGQKYNKVYSVDLAKKHLTSSKLHRTRSLQSVTIQFPVGKGRKKFILTDTTGLEDGIHREESIRKAMAQTLAAFQYADLIIHLLDISSINKSGYLESLDLIDRQLIEYGREKKNYIVLANKMDLPEAPDLLEKINGQISGVPVFPISSLTREGFSEVKSYVWRNI